jgi:hypothetical protein
VMVHDRAIEEFSGKRHPRCAGSRGRAARVSCGSPLFAVHRTDSKFLTGRLSRP